MALVVGLAAALALLMTGCVREHVDFTVNSDDTVSIAGTMALDDAFLAQMASMQGLTAEEFLERMKSDPDLNEQLGAKGKVDLEDYAADGYTGWTFQAREPETLESFNEPGEDDSTGDVTVTRRGDEFVVNGEIDMTPEALGPEYAVGDDPATQSLLNRLDLKITFTFPGKVKSSTGVIDGNKVTFTPKMGERTKIEAVASAKAGLGSLLVILGIAVGVIAVVALLAIMLLKGKKKRAAARAAAEAPADLGYPGAGYPGFGQPGFGQPGFGAPPAGAYPPAVSQPQGFGAPPGAAVPPAAPQAFGAPPAAGYPAQPGYPPAAAGVPGAFPAPGYPPPGQAFGAQPPMYGVGPAQDDAPPPLSQPVARPGEIAPGQVQPPQQPAPPQQPVWPPQQQQWPPPQQ
jgi:hypothetical protein